MSTQSINITRNVNNVNKIKVREDILKVKSLIQEPGAIRVRSDLEEIMAQLRELGMKVEELRRKWESERGSISLKRKKQIIALLKNKEMTALEIGRALGISRTRATEYLKKLEREGIVEGRYIGKRKYYGLKGEKG